MFKSRLKSHSAAHSFKLLNAIIPPLNFRAQAYVSISANILEIATFEGYIAKTVLKVVANDRWLYNSKKKKQSTNLCTIYFRPTISNIVFNNLGKQHFRSPSQAAKLTGSADNISMKGG